MRGPTQGLIFLLALTLVMGSVPDKISASQDAPTRGALGITLAEWEAMSIDARRQHLRSMSKEDRRALLNELRKPSDRVVPAGRTSRTKVSRSARPAAKVAQPQARRQGHLNTLFWDPSKLQSRSSEEGGDDDSGLTPPGIVRYDTGNAIGFFASGDFKGNRFDTKNGQPIPNSARFDRIGVQMSPSPPPIFTVGAFRNPIVEVKILGPAGTDLGGGNVLVQPGANILDVNPPLHFSGQNLHIGVADLPGYTDTYSFDVSGAVYFYGTFRFAYYRYYNTVLTYSFMTTLYFSTSYQLPFYGTTLFGGVLPFPISSFTAIFGTVFYQYIPVSRFAPVADAMSVMGQGFHGENMKSDGSITEINNRNFGVWIIPLETEIFSYDHELGTIAPWSSSQP